MDRELLLEVITWALYDSKWIHKGRVVSYIDAANDIAKAVLKLDETHDKQGGLR